MSHTQYCKLYYRTTASGEGPESRRSTQLCTGPGEGPEAPHIRAFLPMDGYQRLASDVNSREEEELRRLRDDVGVTFIITVCV